MRKVDFAIIGVAKSATTFVHEALRSHPEIFMEDTENVAFHSENWEEALAPVLAGATEAQRRVCGIKRPNLMFFEDAIGRLKEHNPHMRTMALLRHPIERAVAHYFHMINYSYAPVEAFDTGIRAILSGALQKDWPRTQEVLDFSRYANPIARLFGTFDRGKILLLTHDDVKIDAGAVVRAACAFLGVDRPEKAVLPTARPQKVMYSLERLRFLRHRNEAIMELDQFGRALRSRERAPHEWETVWSYAIAEFDQVSMSKRFPNVPPRIDDVLWGELYDFFRGDIARTEELLGRKMPGWHQNPLPA